MSLCNLTIQQLENQLHLSLLAPCPVEGCGIQVARHRNENAGNVTGESRLAKIIASLKKCNINVNSEMARDTLEKLVKNDRNLEIGSVDTEFAFRTYENVKNAASTQTKSCIGSELGMRVNGAAFDDFPFILTAHDKDNMPKLVKILRVPEGVSELKIRQQDVRYEAECCKFAHPHIVPMERKTIIIDTELAQKANCRVGTNEVLIMPWYISTLNKHPSYCLDWIAVQGSNILDALKYLHSHPDGGYAHMDVKAMNIFVDHVNTCILGDFGSCKPIGVPITSCSVNFCWEDVIGQLAHPKYDYFMFLLMVLVECLEDRREYKKIFYDENAKFASISKVFNRANELILQDTSPPALKELLNEVVAKLKEFLVFN